MIPVFFIFLDKLLLLSAQIATVLIRRIEIVSFISQKVIEIQRNLNISSNRFRSMFFIYTSLYIKSIFFILSSSHKISFANLILRVAHGDDQI